jgi:hypothetical protein
MWVISHHGLFIHLIIGLEKEKRKNIISPEQTKHRAIKCA